MFNKTTLCKSVLALAAITFVVAFSSCGDKNADRFKEAALNLDNTTLTLEWEYDYWPNGDIRNVGGHLASLISLQELQKMLPCPLYLSGPHHNGEWNLYSEDFGHYNPQAIKYLADLAKKVVSDKKFVNASKPLVDKYLGRQMRIMMVFHDVMYDENMYTEEGRNVVFSEVVEGYGYSDEMFYTMNSIYIPELSDDESYLYWNFNTVFFYWWARRWKDGTIDQFYDGLSTIFKAYYPDYEYRTENYFFQEEYDDWYEYEELEETTYTVELESDDPIAVNERIKESDAIAMLKDAAYKLDKTFDAVDDVFDYWPECGLRNTAGHLFSLISMRTLNRILPCDLYVSGSHYVNRWNFEDPWDFGHYNPEAIQYLNQLATKIVADKKFVENTRPLVDEYLKRQMFILKSLYDALNNPDICPDKEAVLEEMMGTQGWYYGEGVTSDFVDMLDLNDDTYVYANTGNMFLYWWARRYTDGTMELFHEGLETIYNAYYPD